MTDHIDNYESEFNHPQHPLGEWLDSVAKAETEEEMWEWVLRQRPPQNRIERQQVRGLLIRVLGAKRVEFDASFSPAQTADAWLKDDTFETDDDLQGEAFAWDEETPWDEPVSGDVLDRVLETFRRYVHTTTENLVALTLWVVYSHCFDAFGVSPLLEISSPTKRCGKSSTMVVLYRLVPRALLSGNITPAALFRAITAWKPTLLIDEADSFLKMADDLRGILNAGHTRDTAFLIRSEGDRNEPRVFVTWAPKAVAAIGRLPDTIEDRAVRIVLSRKSTSVRTEDAFDTEAVVDACVPVRRQVARFVLDNAGKITLAKPERPDGLGDRAWNNWKPLLAVAEAAGGPWPERAREAALALGGRDDSDSEDVGTLALRHIWQVLCEHERISTTDLLSRLVQNEEGPWARWWARDVEDGKTKAPAANLAKILKPFGIKPDQFKVDGVKTRGYRREDFEGIASTYLELDGTDGTNGTSRMDKQAEVPSVPLVPSSNGASGGSLQGPVNGRRSRDEKYASEAAGHAEKYDQPELGEPA